MLTWELFDRNGISATCTNLRCQMLLPAFALLPIKTFLMDQPWPLFVYFCSFQTIYAIKTEDFCGIWTRIVGPLDLHHCPNYS